MDNVLVTSDSKASVATATRNTGKSSHVAALRSLGLLHDLQEYVASLQQTTVEQEKELSKLKGEKQEAERVLKKELHAPDKQPYLQHFQASEIADLPPRLRALFEDNKVLKEEVRRYKGRTRDAERTAAQQGQQLATFQEQVKRLKHQIAEGAASPEALAAEEQARQQADAATRALQKLQDAHKILQQKLESDTRSHKQALSSAAKERHQLEQQLHELQQQLNIKDKEARASALAAKKAERRMHDLKATAAEALAGVNAAVAKAVAAERAQQRQATQSNSGPHDNWSQQDSTPVAAAAAGADGAGDDRYSSRSGLLYSRDEAVVVLQAGARGYLTRKRLKEQQQQKEQTAVVIQMSSRNIEVWQQQKALVGEQQQQQQQVLGAESSGSFRGAPAKEGDQVTASTSFAEREGLWQSPAADAPAVGPAAPVSGVSALPMDLPLLPHAPESAGGDNSAGPPVVVRSSSGGQHHTSGIGGGPGQRMRASAPQFTKSASQAPRAQRQAGSASPRLINKNSNDSAGSRRTGSVLSADKTPKKSPDSAATFLQQQSQRRMQRQSLQQQPGASPGQHSSS